MDSNLLTLYQRVSSLEQQVQAQDEALKELTEAVRSLTEVIAASKGSLRTLGYIIGFTVTIATVVNFIVNIWHKI